MTTTDVSYDYDKLGRLVQVAATTLNGSAASSTTDYAYFASGQLARQDTDGVVSTWGYDPLGRLLRLATESAAGELALFTYALDKAGHRLRIDETIDPDPTTSNDEFTRTAEYEYDQLYRLTKETVIDVLAGVTRAFEQSYTFDLAGNRLRKIIAQVASHSLPSGWSAGTVTSDYNARDQLDASRTELPWRGPPGCPQAPLSFRDRPLSSCRRPPVSRKRPPGLRNVPLDMADGPLRKRNVPLHKEDGPLRKRNVPLDKGDAPLDKAEAPFGKGDGPPYQAEGSPCQGNRPPCQGNRPLDKGNRPLDKAEGSPHQENAPPCKGRPPPCMAEAGGGMFKRALRAIGARIGRVARGAKQVRNGS